MSPKMFLSTRAERREGRVRRRRAFAIVSVGKSFECFRIATNIDMGFEEILARAKFVGCDEVGRRVRPLYIPYKILFITLIIQ